MTALNRKLLREIWHLKGQMISIALVVATGIMSVITMRGSYETLVEAQQSYYRDTRFADIWISLVRAPEAMRENLESIPGVETADTRVTFLATLDFDEPGVPALGRFVSIPETGRPGLNNLLISRGRYIAAGVSDEVILSENFAEARALNPGDELHAIINGRARALRIVGIATSPEHTYAVPPGSLYPEDRRYGVMWMNREVLGPAYDMDGAFNEAFVRITPDANPDAVIAELDTLLAPYGGLGAYAREDQPSHLILQSELDQNRIIGSVIPAIFLAVAVFLLNLVLGRMITTQRGEIAVLKAFGYNNREIGLHYLMFAVAAVMLGTVIGTVGGLFLGDGYITLYSQYFELPDLEYRLSPTLLLISIVISLVGAVTGAMAAVRRAIALPPAEAMRPEAPARFRPGFLEKIGFAALLSSAGRMILRNLERKPLQAVFSSIGVAMSVAILVIGLFMFDSINYLVELQFRNIQREDIALTFREIVPRSVGYELQHLPGVTRVETYRTVPARLRAAHREQETGITGMQPDGRLRRLVNSSAREVPVPPDGIILGKFLADRLRLENGDAVTIEILEGRRQTAEVEVVGIIEEFLGISAYMSLSGLQRLTGDSEVVSGAYLAVDQSGIDQLYQNIKQIPAVAGVSSPASMLESFEQQLSEGILLSAGFLLAFAGVIAVGVIYNGARIALSERGRELASLRVMGFHRREVAMLLLGEQALITLFAIPIGWLIGYGLAFSISTGLETDTFRIPFIADPGTFILSAGIVMAAAVASGLAVRRRLDRIDLVEVLKTRE